MAAELTRLGRYELRRILGRGAMGVVYEGFDPNLSRRVAVKTILRSAALDEETERAYSERFVREAQAVARLNHPNIVQVYDFGEQNEVAYLVMEFIEGRELRSFFDKKERFGLPEVVRIMGELLDALDLAHDAGVIHRDIKPANVMLDAQRRVKLADFGVARVQDSDRSAAGTMVGTPAFMSPEQISGGKIDRRTDIFSTGVVLYQLLTGEQPFKGEGAWTVAKKIMQDDPPLPSTLVQGVPTAFDNIVNHALAKNPAQRFARARDFAAALRATQTPANQSAPPSTPAVPVPKAKASEAEVEFWKAIQSSTDAAEFEFYLEQFPDGTYSQLARHKIAKLKGSAAAAEDDQRTLLATEAQEKARQEAAAKAQREAEEKAKREAEEKARREAEEKARREAEEKARREAQERAKREAEEKARKDAEEKARREAEAKAKREAEERARREAEEKAKREAEAKAKREAEEKAKREAEEKAKREAEAKAKREAEEKARREAAEKAKKEAEERARREAEEKKRRAEALARLEAEEKARAKAAIDEDATVAMRAPEAPVATPPAAPVPPAAGKLPVVPLVAAAVIVLGAVVGYFVMKREPAPAPVAQAPEAKPAAPAVDVEKIKRETEERIRREYAEKSKAEQAAAAKAAAEKEIAERQAAAKAAAEKAAAEKKLAAEKAAAEKKLAAEKAATDKASAEKAAAAKAAAEKLAAEKAAAEKAAAEKLAAEKAAAEKVAAQKATAPKGPPAAGQLPGVGDRWMYVARDADRPSNQYQVSVEVQAVTASSVRELVKAGTQPAVTLNHQPGAVMTGIAPGIASFSPYLRAFQEPRAGDSWPTVEARNLWGCSAGIYNCSIRARFAGKERTSVPAGSFDTWKFVVEIQGTFGTAEFTYWHADEAKRLVKYMSRLKHRTSGSTGSTQWSLPNVTMELASYGKADSARKAEPAEPARASATPTPPAEAKAPAEQVASVKPAPAVAAAPAKPGWPSVGDVWVYDLHGLDVGGQMKIVVNDVVENAIGQAQHNPKGGTPVVHFSSDAQVLGNFRGLADFQPYLFAFNQPRAGYEWPKVTVVRYGDCFQAGRTCTATARIKGREKVTVKAGTFDAWVVVVDVELSPRGGGLGPGNIRPNMGITREHTYWFAESVRRFVKQQSRNRGSATGPEVDMELVSYTPAGK